MNTRRKKMGFQPATLPEWISAIATVAGVMFAIYAYWNWKSPIIATKQLDLYLNIAEELDDYLALSSGINQSKERTSNFTGLVNKHYDLKRQYDDKTYLLEPSIVILLKDISRREHKLVNEIISTDGASTKELVTLFHDMRKAKNILLKRCNCFVEEEQM